MQDLEFIAMVCHETESGMLGKDSKYQDLDDIDKDEVIDQVRYILDHKGCAVSEFARATPNSPEWWAAKSMQATVLSMTRTFDLARQQDQITTLERLHTKVDEYNKHRGEGPQVTGLNIGFSRA